MSEFTKGPWTIETPCGFPYSGLYVVPVVRKDFPFYIAQVRQLREREESEANADLIASAPTLKQQREALLTACEAQKKANEWFGSSDTGRKLKETARMLTEAAIAKCKV